LDQLFSNISKISPFSPKTPHKTVLFDKGCLNKVQTTLFFEISKKPKKYINNYQNKDQFRSISDYISGMTDRYAIQLHKSLK